MAVKDSTRFKRSLLTYFIAFLSLCAVFGINLILSLLRESIEGNPSGTQSKTDQLISTIISISFISSIVIANNNAILSKIVRYISKFERHETYTKFNLTIAIKLTACMLINTAAIPFIVKPNKEKWFRQNGLANDALLIVATMNIITPTINLIGFSNLYKKLRIKLEVCKGKKSKMTQKEANKLYEGLEFDQPFLYATTMTTFFITCFFTPLIPMLPIISIIGLIYKYYVDKYLLLRRSKLPQEMAEQMAMAFSNLIPIGLFFYALGQFIFVTDLSNGGNKLPHLALWFSVLSLIIPVRLLLKKCQGEI